MYRLKPSATRVPPIMTNLNVNGENLSFEVDTGAAISVISETTYETLWPIHIISPRQRSQTNPGKQSRVFNP